MRWLSIAVLAGTGATASSIGLAADDDSEESSRFYAGLGAETLEYSVEHEGIEFTDTSTGLDLFGGYRLNDWLGVELAYKTFDDIGVEGIWGSGTTRLDIDMSLDIVVAKAVGQLSFRDLLGWERDWRVYGTAGLYQTDFERSAVTLGTGVTEIVRDEKSGLTVGAGALYRLGPVDLRGYVEWLGFLDEDEAWNAGLAVQFSF